MATQTVLMKKLYIITASVIALVIVVFVIVTFCPSVRNKSVEGKMEEYLLIERRGKAELHLPFVYQSGGLNAEIYKNYMFGVKVINMYADGVSIKPEKFIRLIDDIDTSTIKIDAGGGYIYLADTNEYYDDDEYWRLVFNDGERGVIKLMQYSIPRKASGVVIDYTVNLPNQKYLGCCVLRVNIE